MRKSIICTLIVLATTFTGCSFTNKNRTPEEPAKQTASISSTQENIKTEIKSEDKNISRYTGEQLKGNSFKNAPFMAIVENSTAARPQSGLSEADIIFETMAEGGIPRFIALFQKNSPKVIGPIRSARPYFLTIAREYSLPFAHCGGSQEALDTIKNDVNLKSINEMFNGTYFWRSLDRTAPHNLYTSAENMRKLISAKSLTSEPKSDLQFDDAIWDSLITKDIKEIKLVLNNSYSTFYKYNNGKYVKYMDNKLAVDKNNDTPLSFTNIIIQKTSMKLKSDKYRLDIDLVGNGEGVVYSKGKAQVIKWSKKDASSPTKLFDENNHKIYLSTGNTIWHIVNINQKIEEK